MTKICKDCGAIRDGVCILCKAAKARKWRTDNSEQNKAAKKRQYQAHKAKQAAEKAGDVDKEPAKAAPWLTVHHIGDTPLSRDVCQAQRQFPQMASPLEY